MHLAFLPYPLTLRHVFTVATCSRTSTPGVQVAIRHGEFTGYGEASMPPYLGESIDSVVRFLGLVDLERFPDPFCLEDILTYIDGLAPGNTAAKAAIDIALHDLVGKIIGAPWYRIWGLNAATAPFTTYTIGIDSPEKVVAKTREVAERFRLLKVKLGGGNDEEMIRSIRSVSTLPLAIDANQGWADPQEALDKIQWLYEEGAVMIEQPLSKTKIAETAWLTRHSPLPIFADESVQRLADVPRLRDTFSGINIKLMKCTGMREAWKMLTLARSLDMRVMIGCMTETSCAVSAAAQLAPAVDFADLDGNLLISNDPFRGMQVEEGRITLTDRPGIGVEPLYPLSYRSSTR